jgi:5-methylcytosine-specific restriction endonuclease McrA
MICPVCHKDFTPIKSTQYCCGKLCSNKYRHEQQMKDPVWVEKKRQRDRDRMRRICKTNKYREYQTDRNHKIGKCKKWGKTCRVYFNICKETGELFTARKKNQAYSEKGLSLRQQYYDSTTAKERGRIRKIQGKSIRVCKQCGATYDLIENKGRRTYCSDKCARKAERNQKKLKSHGNHKRRSEYYGVEYEHIQNIQIFERDKWICQLCGCNTPKSLMGKNKPNSPELDHIIPISKGGDHKEYNLQLLCRQCNSSKGANIIGQLRIAL